MIGAIAIVLCAGGLALMVWSGFWVDIYGVVIGGAAWSVIGIIIAVLTTKKEHAL